MLEAADLIDLVREYREYVVPALSALGYAALRESPRLLRWAANAARFAGRLAYACVVRPDSDVVKALLAAIETGKVVSEKGGRPRVEAGEFHVASSWGGASPRVCRGGIDVTAGLTARELDKVVKAAGKRVAAVRKAADEANAAAARALVAEGLRGNA